LIKFGGGGLGGGFFLFFCWNMDFITYSDR
jgi:hypothetical protein